MSFNFTSTAQIGEEVLKTIRECSDRYASTGKINISVQFMPDGSTDPVERSITVNITSRKQGTEHSSSPVTVIASEPVVMVPLEQVAQVESPSYFGTEHLVYATNVYPSDDDQDTEMAQRSPPPLPSTSPNQQIFSSMSARPQKVFKLDGVYHCGFPGCHTTGTSPAKIYRHRYVGHETTVRCPQRGCNKQFHSRKGLTKHLATHRAKSRGARRRDSSLGREKQGREKMLRPRNIGNPRESSTALGKVLRKKQLTRTRSRVSRRSRFDKC